MNRITCIVFLCLISMGWGTFLEGADQRGPALAQSQASKSDIMDLIQSHLLEKTRISGTLDIFDVENDVVRNLRKISGPEKLKDENGVYIAFADYRDINSGDLVNIKITVEEQDGNYTVANLIINKITALKKVEVQQLGKEYSDQEIQDVMKGYLKSQAKFTGSLSLYDEDNKKLRSLKEEKLHQEVRRLGDLYISRVEFTDMESKERVGVDITVENKQGILDIQSLRLREVQ